MARADLERPRCWRWVCVLGTARRGARRAGGDAQAVQACRPPTAQPGPITNGIGRQRWFTEGTESRARPRRSRGSCRRARSPSSPRPRRRLQRLHHHRHRAGSRRRALITSNDPALMRFDTANTSFLAPIQMPNSIARRRRPWRSAASDAWITDFDSDVVWRSGSATWPVHLLPGHRAGGRTRSTPPATPRFTQPDDVRARHQRERPDRRAPRSGHAAKRRPPMAAAERQPSRSRRPASGTARCTPQAVGRLEPEHGRRHAVGLTDVGPPGSRPLPRQRLVAQSATPRGSPRRRHHGGQGGEVERAVRDRRRARREPDGTRS